MEDGIIFSREFEYGLSLGIAFLIVLMVWFAIWITSEDDIKKH